MVSSLVKGIPLALLAMLFVAPSARAQTPPLSIIGASAFGPGDCRNDTPINVSYTFVTPTTIPQSQNIQLFVTKQSSCPQPETNASTVTEPSDAVILVPANTQPQTTSAQTATLHVSDLAAPGGGCDTRQTATWQVCFYEFYLPVNQFGSSNWVALQNSTKLTYDAQPPGAANITNVSPGDQQLHLDFDAPGDGDIASYTVLLAPADQVQFGTATSTTSTGTSGTSSSGSSASGSASGSSSGSVGAASGSSSASGSTGGSGSDSGSTGSSGSTASSSATSTTTSGGGGSNACMTGPNVITFSVRGVSSSLTAPDADQPLVNGVQYAVQIQAVDNANNTGPCSNVAYGTPQIIDDFWRLYTKSGGGDPGGCTHAGGLTLLAFLGAGLLLARRNKDRA